MARTIMILAGGTGGHVYPALAVAQAFQQQGFDIIWIGTKKGIEARLVPEQGLKIDWLDMAGLRGKGFLRLFFAPLILTRALWQMWRLFRLYKPVLALGMGGFVAWPGGVMAKLLGCPLVIHEQNSIAGMTNRFLARLANRVLTGFPNVFPGLKKAVYVGNPVRDSMRRQKVERNYQQHKPLSILVFGGSLGARAINQVMPPCLAQLQQQGCDFRVLHQSGKLDYEQVLKDYQQFPQLADKVETRAYIDDMDIALQQADLAICRAGAMTVAEIMVAALPAIFIPYPYAVDDHQTGNAMALVKDAAAILIQQKALNVTLLTETLHDLCQHREKLHRMSEQAKSKAKPNATEEIVQLCLQEIANG